MHIKGSMQNGGGLVPTQERARAYGARESVPKLVWRVELVAELQPYMPTEASPHDFACSRRWTARAAAGEHGMVLLRPLLWPGADHDS